MPSARPTETSPGLLPADSHGHRLRMRVWENAIEPFVSLSCRSEAPPLSLFGYEMHSTGNFHEMHS